MTIRHAAVTFLVTLLVCGSGFGGDRFFYRKGSQAYYCEQPAQYQDGCYIVTDRAGVIKIGDYPTITEAEANKLCASCPQAAYGTTSVLSGQSPASWCCKNSPSGVPCWPFLSSQCKCSVQGPPVPAPPSNPGALDVEVKQDGSFYAAIVVIQGTVPMPKICVTTAETYAFSNLTLTYDCAQQLANSDKAKECGPEKCTTPCTVQTCRVDSKTTACNATCVMCDVKGPLVLAIRRTGTADVFIGTAGLATFKAYPANMMVLQSQSAAVINANLKLSGAEAVDFNSITSGPASNNTDLFSFLK